MEAITNTKILYTVKEVAAIMHTNPAFVYSINPPWKCGGFFWWASGGRNLFLIVNAFYLKDNGSGTV